MESAADTPVAGSGRRELPAALDGKCLTSFGWTPIRYRNAVVNLKHRFCAEAHVYATSENRIEQVDWGRASHLVREWRQRPET